MTHCVPFEVVVPLYRFTTTSYLFLLPLHPTPVYRSFPCTLVAFHPTTTGKKKVAGCAVLSGKLQKNAMVTVKRGKATVFEGKLSSLRRVKDLVEEVKEGFECGVGCDDFLEWAVGDTLECFTVSGE
jgi:translation initiation factor IF-2